MGAKNPKTVKIVLDGRCKGVLYLSYLEKGHFFCPLREAITYLGGAVMRIKITLACTECKQRNYNTNKNKKNTPDRLEMSKYCRFCKKHTAHKETK